MRRIKTAADPFEPFALSQAIAVDPWIFVSGQAAIDSQGLLIGGDDFKAQAIAAFDNLQAVLSTAGSGLEDVVKVTIFVTDMSHFPTVVELRRHYFNVPYPADSIIEVKALALPSQLFEIEAIAIRGAGRDKHTGRPIEPASQPTKEL
jgi:reactive intermediate/imine deaminase